MGALQDGGNNNGLPTDRTLLDFSEVTQRLGLGICSDHYNLHQVEYYITINYRDSSTSCTSGQDARAPGQATGMETRNVVPWWISLEKAMNPLWS